MKTATIIYLALVISCILPIATATYCLSKGMSVFQSSPISYLATEASASQFCPQRGLPLNPTTIRFDFSDGYSTPEHPYVINLKQCVQDGRIVIMVHKAPAPQHEDYNTGTSFEIYSGATSNSITRVTPYSNRPAISGSADDVNTTMPACSLAYFNLTNLGGTGVRGENTVTWLRIRTFSDDCFINNDGYYWVKLINKPCENTPQPFCIFKNITVNENITPAFPKVYNLSTGLLPFGKSDSGLHTLSSYVYGTDIFLWLSSLTTFTYFTMQWDYQLTNGGWSSKQTVGGITASNPVVGANGILVPWRATAVNRYTFTISSTSINNSCSEKNIVLRFCNPPRPSSSSSTGVAGSSSSSSTGVARSSSSSSTGVAGSSSSSIEIPVQSSTGEDGGGVGDPQFTGLRGQSFQIHGYDGAVFNIISNKHFQLNSLFVFLTGPRPCPIMPSGQKAVACWSHDGSYLGDIGLKTNKQDEISIKPGSAEAGFAEVKFNNRALEIGETVTFTYANENLFGEDEENNKVAEKMLQVDGLNQGTIKRISSHELIIEISCFKMEIENVDSFVNLRRLSIPSAYRSTIAALRTHGLLGQTWQLKRYKGYVKEIEGDVDDYVVEDGIFGNDFLFNRISYM